MVNIAQVIKVIRYRVVTVNPINVDKFHFYYGLLWLAIWPNIIFTHILAFSLALGQSYNNPGSSEETVGNMGKWVTQIHESMVMYTHIYKIYGIYLAAHIDGRCWHRNVWISLHSIRGFTDFEIQLNIFTITSIIKQRQHFAGFTKLNFWPNFNEFMLEKGTKVGRVMGVGTVDGLLINWIVKI